MTHEALEEVAHRVRTHRRTAQVLILATTALMSMALPASAQVGINLQAGVFDPWNGQDGYEIGGSILTRIGDDRDFRIGGELMYRQFESEYFNVKGVETHSIRLAFVAHYIILPEAPVQPYVGGKFNIAVNVIDGDAIEAARPNLDVIDVGTGLGLAGVVGVDIPIGDHFAFYGEVAASADLQLTDEDGSYEAENIGGVSGVGGIRVLF